MTETRSVPLNKRGRPNPAAGKKRKQILDAGVGVFLQRGYHATRIEDIVARAGVGKGTFYLYFDEKEDVFAAALDGFSDAIRQALASTWESVGSGVTLAELFRRQAESLFAIFLRERDVARLILREGRSVSEAIEAKIDAAYREIIEVSRQTLELAAGLGLLPPLQAQVVSICIVGAVERVYEQWLKGELNEPTEEIARATSLFLQRGCGLPDSAIQDPRHG